MPAAGRSDLATFETCALSDDPRVLATGAALARGEFLEGLGPVSPEFDMWPDAELGLTPEAETVALMREIRALRQRPAAVAGDTPDPPEIDPAPSSFPRTQTRRASVAVLPFRVLSSDETAAYFGEGIAEDIIIELSRDRGLMVISRHSSFRYTESSYEPARIGRDLGVRDYLSGSVRMMGGQVRVSAHLVRAEDGLRRIREAFRLNPFHPVWHWNVCGRCLHVLGRHADAIDAFRRVTDPPFCVWAYRAACHHAVGDAAERDAAKQRLFQAKPDFGLDAWLTIFPYRSPATAKRFFDEFRAAGL